MRSVQISALGRAIADPNRAEVLCVLEGRSPRTAGQLAAHLGLAPSTTSRHLSELVDAGLVEFDAAGRHRYYRLRSHEVSDLLRTIDAMDLPARSVIRTRRGNEITTARTCYDHLAGDIGVRVFQSMIAKGWIEAPTDQPPRLTATGHARLRALGIDTEWLGAQRRPLVRGCLDWEQRTRHTGGGLGSALLSVMLREKWLTRGRDDRVVAVTPFGVRQLSDHFDVDVGR